MADYDDTIDNGPIWQVMLVDVAGEPTSMPVLTGKG